MIRPPGKRRAAGVFHPWIKCITSGRRGQLTSFYFQKQPLHPFPLRHRQIRKPGLKDLRKARGVPVVHADKGPLGVLGHLFRPAGEEMFFDDRKSSL